MWTSPQRGEAGEEGLRISEAVEHSGSLMVASWGAGVLSLRHGDLPRALPLLERAVSICQDPDLSVWFTRIAPSLGMTYTLPLMSQALLSPTTPG